MIISVMLTQAVLLFYGTRLFPVVGKLDESRFFCYGLIIFCGILALRKIKLRKILFLDLVACGILAFAFLSYVYSIDPKLTLLRSTGNLLMYLAIFWALWITCRTPKDAYKLIQKHAQKAWTGGKDFKNLILKSPEIREVLGEKAVHECFDPAYFVRHRGLIFKRAGL